MDGGDNRYGGGGGAGGGGAGGGILLMAPSVSISGALDARGGGGATQNGGTIKVFGDVRSLGGTLYYGRLFESAY